MEGGSESDPAGGAFPATRVSVLAALGSADAQQRRRALESIVAAYWRPVYKYLRMRWQRSDADAVDLTQGFFAAATEKDYLAAFEPSKGRFRTFLRVCVDRFASRAASAERAAKRGGEAVRLELDFEGAERELAGAGGIDDVERWFEREWARSIFTNALADLRRSGEGRPHFALRLALFERYDLAEPEERPTYAALAEQHGVKVTDVTNHLAAMRRELRAAVLATLRELTASDEEFRAEARALLGVEPGR
jgi:DNA-directed RNA polymerase specialized sigma24 family protein